MTDLSMSQEEAETLDIVEKHPRVEEHDDGKRTVTLATSVETKKGLVESLTFRKPKGRDWRDTDRAKGQFAKMYALAAALTDQPAYIFDKMDGDDALLCTMVASIMGKSRTTGETSLEH